MIRLRTPTLWRRLPALVAMVATCLWPAVTSVCCCTTASNESSPADSTAQCCIVEAAVDRCHSACQRGIDGGGSAPADVLPTTVDAKELTCACEMACCTSPSFRWIRYSPSESTPEIVPVTLAEVADDLHLCVHPQSSDCLFSSVRFAATSSQRCAILCRWLS